MYPLIHSAIEQGLTQFPPRRLDDKIWISDLGKNPYGMARRLAFQELEPFGLAVRLKMDGGNALEDSSSKYLTENLPRTVLRQVPLWDDTWAGYADWVIGHFDDNGEVIIADHKATGERWWDYKDSLPRTSDCLQVWKYGDVYQARYGVKPELRIYYRSWGPWAEFVIEETEDGFKADGFITDDKGAASAPVLRYREVQPRLLARELEDLRLRILSYGITGDEIDSLDPGGPDWDYAERRSAELLAKV